MTGQCSLYHKQPDIAACLAYITASNHTTAKTATLISNLIYRLLITMNSISMRFLSSTKSDQDTRGLKETA